MNKMDASKLTIIILTIFVGYFCFSFMNIVNAPIIEPEIVVVNPPPAIPTVTPNITLTPKIVDISELGMVDLIYPHHFFCNFFLYNDPIILIMLH